MEDFVEPGAVRYGNFINYYDFNSAPERLSLLPSDDNLWKISTDDSTDAFLVLDVGCNAGNFTQLLYEFLVEKKANRKVIVFGIDIDPSLIERATEANQYPENVFYSCFNIMEYESEDNCVANQLKLHGKTRFDVVSCFSITMWIHLNNGDDGLEQFLHCMTKFSEILIIEPQPWKCYQNAVRRMKRAGAQNTFPLYSNLRIRNDVEHFIKTHIQNRKEFELIFESDPTKWKRTICMYRKNV